MTQGQPDASGKPCPICKGPTLLRCKGTMISCANKSCGIYYQRFSFQTWSAFPRPTPSADADRVREQLERQRAENAKLQRAILHPHEQINPAPKTYGMKKVAYGDEILAELPEGQYVKLEDYRALARHFLKRGAEIERLEAALATPAPVTFPVWVLLDARHDVAHKETGQRRVVKIKRVPPKHPSGSEGR